MKKVCFCLRLLSFFCLCHFHYFASLQLSNIKKGFRRWPFLGLYNVFHRPLVHVNPHLGLCPIRCWSILIDRCTSRQKLPLGSSLLFLARGLKKMSLRNSLYFAQNSPEILPDELIKLKLFPQLPSCFMTEVIPQNKLKIHSISLKTT